MNSQLRQEAKSSHKGKIHALDSKSFLFRVDQYSTSLQTNNIDQ